MVQAKKLSRLSDSDDDDDDENNSGDDGDESRAELASPVLVGELS